MEDKKKHPLEFLDKRKRNFNLDNDNLEDDVLPPDFCDEAIQLFEENQVFHVDRNEEFAKTVQDFIIETVGKPYRMLGNVLGAKD